MGLLDQFEVVSPEYCSLHQALFYVATGEPILQLEDFEDTQGHRSTQKLNKEASGYEEAEDALLIAFRTGNLTAYGKRKGQNKFDAIPQNQFKEIRTETIDWKDNCVWWVPDVDGPDDWYDDVKVLTNSLVELFPHNQRVQHVESDLERPRDIKHKTWLTWLNDYDKVRKVLGQPDINSIEKAAEVIAKASDRKKSTIARNYGRINKMYRDGKIH